MSTYSISFGSRNLVVCKQKEWTSEGLTYYSYDSVSLCNGRINPNRMMYKRDERQYGNFAKNRVYNKIYTPPVYTRDSLTEWCEKKQTESDAGEPNARSGVEYDNALTNLIAFFHFFVTNALPKENDKIIIVIPYDWSCFEKKALLQAAEIESLHNVWLVPDCCACAAIHGHYHMMHNKYEKKSTTMFIDIGASHTSCFICGYEKKNMTIEMYASTRKVSGILVDDIVKNMVKEEIEKNKEDIEDAGETVEYVKGDAMFLCHEAKLDDLKHSLCTQNVIDASIEWSSRDYADSFTITQDHFFEQLEGMKENLVRFIAAVVSSYRERGGKRIDQVEVLGGTSNVPLFVDAVEEFLSKDNAVVLPKKVRKTLNCIECLAQGGCLMDMCVKSQRTQDVSDPAFFSFSLSAPCFFDDEAFKMEKDKYSVRFTKATENVWKSRSVSWERGNMLTYAYDSQAQEVVMQAKDLELSVKNKTSVMVNNPSKRFKFPEMFFYVDCQRLTSEVDVKVKMVVDKHGIPHVVGENEATTVEEFFVPLNGNTLLSTIRRSVKEAVEGAALIESNPSEQTGADTKEKQLRDMLLSRAAFNTRQCSKYEEKRHKINFLKNECDSYFYNNEGSFSEEQKRVLDFVRRKLVNGDKKESVEIAMKELEKLNDGSNEHVMKYSDLGREMERLFEESKLHRVDAHPMPLIQ